MSSGLGSSAADVADGGKGKKDSAPKRAIHGEWTERKRKSF